MRPMNVMPAMASYRPASAWMAMKVPLRMSGAQPSFDIEAGLVEQLKAKPGQPVYRRLADDKVLCMSAELPEEENTNYSVRASMLGVRPRSYYHVLTLSPEWENGYSFTVVRAKDGLRDEELPPAQRNQEVPMLQRILTEGRASSMGDYMDVMDRYD